MRLSDWVDAQADLRLFCLHMAKMGFAHDVAHLVSHRGSCQLCDLLRHFNCTVRVGEKTLEHEKFVRLIRFWNKGKISNS